MSRVTYAVPSRKRRKRTLERAKGFYGNSSKNIRTVYDAVDKALTHSYRGRSMALTLIAAASRRSSSIAVCGLCVSTPPAAR